MRVAEARVTGGKVSEARATEAGTAEIRVTEAETSNSPLAVKITGGASLKSHMKTVNHVADQPGAPGAPRESRVKPTRELQILLFTKPCEPQGSRPNMRANTAGDFRNLADATEPCAVKTAKEVLSAANRQVST